MGYEGTTSQHRHCPDGIFDFPRHSGFLLSFLVAMFALGLLAPLQADEHWTTTNGMHMGICERSPSQRQTSGCAIQQILLSSPLLVAAPRSSIREASGHHYSVAGTIHAGKLRGG